MGIYHNDTKCDLYIGKGAGSMLLRRIKSAEKSIKIISPYLSPELVEELITLKNRDVDIQLITTNEIENYTWEEKDIHKKLIIQNKTTDKEADRLRDGWIQFSSNLLYSMIMMTSVVTLLLFFSRNLLYLLGFVPHIVAVIVYKSYKNKIRNKQVYSYHYTQLFPFKVYLCPRVCKTNNTFIHAKIYLIDDDTVFLGSLNFTYKGTKDNYETRVKITDTEVIDKIKNEFYDLFYHADLNAKNLQKWGAQLYSEPINY